MDNDNKVNYPKKNQNFPKRKSGNSEYAVKKRPLPKNYPSENTVYVTNKTDIKALIKKCENLFNKNITDINIYCTGAAIERGINLGLQISEKYPSARLSVNTSTINIKDDLEPLRDDLDYEIQTRDNSVVHIRVVKENTVDILST